MLPITDITNFTFQDYPEHTACIIWCAGCNFRCPYCHNPEFIEGEHKYIEENKVIDFLQSRIGLLEGVVFSGGECTLSNNLYSFAKKVKDMGFLVKIDTNGTNFELVKKMIEDNILDFVALDYKAPKEKFKIFSKQNIFTSFENTLQYLIDNNINMEIRTTIHTDLLNEEDINSIIEDLDKKGYNKTYYIQNFRNDNKRTLGNLPEQTRILNKDLIIQKSFNIEYRNFF